MRIHYCRCLLALLLGFFNTVTYSQTYPTDFAQVLVANTIANPTAMAFAPDGRIFVAQQGGRLRVIKDGTLLPTPFVHLTVSSTGERGLIGITLDPDFTTNQHIYLYYTVPGSPTHNRVSRFTADGDVSVPGSEIIILDLDPLSSATNHNGGAMHFRKDGTLYIAVGENANSAHAQNLDTYHGKILRINKDGTVPEGNPFSTGSEQRKRVWSYGLRNPFTFSIHPETGQILVNDVGQGSWEEVNDATEPGKNFGWPATEGKFNAATHPALTNPIYAYPRAGGDGNGCAITGGVFFYPSSTNYPANYFDKYFLQDYCNRWINYLDVSATAVRSSFATSIAANGVALSVGNDGNLYYLSRGAGALYKIIYNNALPTAKIISPLDSSLYTAGTEISFSGKGTDPEDGELPMDAFQWEVDFHHDTHKHDQPSIPGVVDGSFFVPDEGETSDNVWYTILLTVTDSKGSTAKDSVRILPRKSVIRVATDPQGLEILIEGQPFSAPQEIISIEGMKRSFGVVSPQVVDGKEFEFEGWSNGGDIVQTLSTPTDDITLTAQFTITVGTEVRDMDASNVILFPNPVTKDHCTIQFSLAKSQEVSIRLVNVLAQQVIAVTKTLVAGQHNLLLNAGQASSGIYYVIINVDGRQVAKKVVIAKQN